MPTLEWDEENIPFPVRILLPNISGHGSSKSQTRSENHNKDGKVLWDRGKDKKKKKDMRND